LSFSFRCCVPAPAPRYPATTRALKFSLAKFEYLNIYAKQIVATRSEPPAAAAAFVGAKENLIVA
jgi:hypothetical protein